VHSEPVHHLVGARHDYGPLEALMAALLIEDRRCGKILHSGYGFDKGLGLQECRERCKFVPRSCRVGAICSPLGS